MPRQLPPTPAVLIRQARLESRLSQAEFARSLGKSQAVISRYEAGSVSPPGEVVMHCMHILDDAKPPSKGGATADWTTVMEALTALTRAVEAMSPPSQSRNR